MLKTVLLIIAAGIVCMGISASEYRIIDVGTDLKNHNIAEKNITPSATEDNTRNIQTVIDHLAGNGGGIMVIPPGIYRINGLVMRPGVEMIGSGKKKTVFRTSGAGDMILMEGGGIRNFTVYGTPTEDVSGDNWIIGTEGIGKGGTARALTLVALRNPKGSVVIDNVEALEARYDCLYVRDCQGLSVTNSHFDRAGRNIFSFVGNSERFLFSGCYFGTYWGLYHSDIEPNEGNWVRNGMFVNCTFDGRDAGGKGGSSWGRMFTFSGVSDRKTRNIGVTDCLFEGINVRIRGVFPQIQFLYNDFRVAELKAVFVQVRTNKGAAFHDARIVGNQFPGIAGDKIFYNVAITGSPVIERNSPEIIYRKTELPEDSSWQEDHPSVLKSDKNIEVVKEDNLTLVKMPLMGFEFNFGTGKAAAMGTFSGNDISMHVDPMIALGKAMIRREDSEFSKQLWNVKPNEKIIVRTNDGKLVEMEITGLNKQSISFRYRFR